LENPLYRFTAVFSSIYYAERDVTSLRDLKTDVIESSRISFAVSFPFRDVIKQEAHRRSTLSSQALSEWLWWGI